MKEKTRIILIILSYFVFSQSLYSQEWLGKILPIKNSVSELNQIIKEKAEKRMEDSLFYKLKEGNLLVEYSLGNCVPGSWGKWNVEKGTIISMTFYPNPKSNYKAPYYNFPKNDWAKQYNQGHIFYTSKRDGITYSTEFGKVSSIIYTPAGKYENLSCK